MSRFSKLFGIGVLVLGVTIAAVAALAAGSPGKALDEQFLKAFNANDLDGIMACYADDAVMYAPDFFAANGKEEIRDGYESFLDEYKVSDAKITDSHYSDMGTKSVAWGVVEVMLTPTAGGDPVPMKVRFTSMAEKRGSKWVYVVDHASVPMPAENPESSESSGGD